ncbi:phage tail tube protein [Sneathiella glossodoripedis]|uniref:phage tail tube protein n=1 Tax=Sneathiella glossodoripedis TaxID=418853 RepID=UPI000470E195|nr:phage tail tube protein [Sneathiella glossodoripedis]
MTFSMQSHHELRFMVEDTYGELPAVADYQLLRHTGCDLALARSSIESDEIRSDRLISHFIHGTEDVEGEIEFELSYGAQDQLLAAVLLSDWVGDELVSGSMPRSFVIERGFADVGEYQLFTGCSIEAMELSIQPESLVSGRFHISGKTGSYGSGSVDSMATSPVQYAPMEAFLGTIEEGGAPLGIVTGLDLKIENGLSGIKALGSRSSVAAGYGKSRISGELSIYFESQSLHQKFFSQSHSSLKVTLSGDGGSYEITLPRILYMSAENPVRADQAVTCTFRFVALADAVSGTDIRLRRIAG